MGQQQLLLIVLGVIVVGIAVVVGINLFNANSISSAKDGIVSDLNNLGSMAQQYYKKPVAMGGGGNTFTGWTIPTKLATTPNATYVLTTGAQTITIVGTGFMKGNSGSTIVGTATVTADSLGASITTQ